MALVKCHECGTEISNTATACPKCGVRAKNSVNTIGALLGVAVAGGLLWFFFGGGIEQQTAKDIQEIHNKVAADTLEQYQIAKRGGDKTQICVQAQILAAAYLQAKDEPNYQRWSAQSKTDCE